MGVSDKNLFLYRDSKLGTALAYDKMAGSRKMMNEKLKANESLDDLMDE